MVGGGPRPSSRSTDPSSPRVLVHPPLRVARCTNAQHARQELERFTPSTARGSHRRHRSSGTTRTRPSNGRGTGSAPPRRSGHGRQWTAPSCRNSSTGLTSRRDVRPDPVPGAPSARGPSTRTTRRTRPGPPAHRRPARAWPGPAGPGARSGDRAEAIGAVASPARSQAGQTVVASAWRATAAVSSDGQASIMPVRAVPLMPWVSSSKRAWCRHGERDPLVARPAEGVAAQDEREDADVGMRDPHHEGPFDVRPHRRKSPGRGPSRTGSDARRLTAPRVPAGPDSPSEM